MALITCPECGKEVSDKAVSCIHCGFPFEKKNEEMFCPYCGTKNIGDAEFCCKCGKNLLTYDNNTQIANVSALPTSTGVTDIMDLTRTPNDALSLQKAQYEQQQKMLDLQRQQMKSQARCPKCGSTSLTSDKKGYGYGKAAVGVLLVGPVGLLAGGIGANKQLCICLNCGFKFRL